MSIIKSIKQVLGLSGTASENHFWDGSVPNQLSLKRGTPDAPGVDVLSIVSGVVSGIFKSPLVFIRASSTQDAVGNGSVFTPLTGWAVTDGAANGTLTSAGVWTPNIAGVYQINFSSNFATAGVSATLIQSIMRKNGAGNSYASQGSNALIFPVVTGSAVVYLNGTTDSIQVGAAQNGAGVVSSVSNEFSAALLQRN